VISGTPKNAGAAGFRVLATDAAKQGLANANISSIDFICDAFDANGNLLHVAEYTALPGYPDRVTLDTAGNFSGKMAAGLFLKKPADLAKAASFKCMLRGQNKSAGLHGVTTALEIGDGTEWWHVKSGVVSVSGPIN
jgi:hypothetical protein